jgi:hypothetical protein
VFTKIVWPNQGDHVHSQTFRREMAQGIGVRRVAAGVLSRLFDSAHAYSQLPTAQQVASQIVLGWTLGNTVETQCGETAWAINFSSGKERR